MSDKVLFTQGNLISPCNNRLRSKNFSSATCVPYTEKKMRDKKSYIPKTVGIHKFPVNLTVL